ncbi:MAG: hypothetical protein KGI59_01005 [Patescibacteria group bacterium]|nr:hypothetical protein [Patescibacteria group bacterium]MDE2172812.1 hypothetical protein [Patescibacteria group bacterium]
MKNEPYAARTHEAMKDVLYDPAAAGPAIHYYMIRGGAKKRNITVWDSGQVGGEYIKTYGHYHLDDFKETYTILAGSGILLLQNRARDQQGAPIDDQIDRFQALVVKPGDSILIPPYDGHLLVNIGDSWLVTSDNSPFGTDETAGAPRHADYEPVKKMRGFAYYVIEQHGRPALVRNPLYKRVPPASIAPLE